MLSPMLFAVYSSTGHHQQEDGDEGCHEETHLCRRPGPGGEWQTGMQAMNRSWLSSSPIYDNCSCVYTH